MQPHSDWKTLRACLLWLHFWSVQLNFLTRWVSVLRMNGFLLLPLTLFGKRVYLAIRQMELYDRGKQWETATANTTRTLHRMYAQSLSFSFLSPPPASPLSGPPLSFPLGWWWLYKSGNILKNIELYTLHGWLDRHVNYISINLYYIYIF